VGALLLNGAVVAVILFSVTPNVLVLALAVGLGMLLLLTHKFSTQTLFLVFVLMSLITLKPVFALFVLLVVVVTTILSKGFYLKVLRSHVDYICFWSKHWRKLGAHMVNDSAIYGGKEPEEISSPLYVPGMASTMIKQYLRDNIYLAIPVAVAVSYLSGADVPDVIWFLSLFSLLVSFVGFFSYVVPSFRGIGFFSQYGKLGLPTGLMCLAYGQSNSPVVAAVGVGVFVVFLIGVGREMVPMLISRLRRDALPADNTGWELDKMEDVFAYIGSCAAPVLMCIPLTYCDLLAYHCRVRVLWGGHTSPTARLVPVLPVLTKRIEDLWREYGVTHLFLDDRYANPVSLGLTIEPVLQQHHFSIYKVP
jgi:hypothetical protein